MKIALLCVVLCLSQCSCYWRQDDGKVYFFSNRADPPVKNTYADAKDACNEQHGGAQLISINSERENNLASRFNYNVWYWIGLECTTGTSCEIADLRWADGSHISFTPDNVFSEIEAGKSAILHIHACRKQSPPPTLIVAFHCLWYISVMYKISKL